MEHPLPELKFTVTTSDDGTTICQAVRDGSQEPFLTLSARSRGTDASVASGIEVLKQALLVDSREVVVEQKTLADGVPVLICCLPDPTPRPLVFYLHGFNSDKIRNLARGMVLAREGFFAVLPDARMHGARRPADFDSRFRFKTFRRNFVDTIRGTAADVSALIDALGKDPRVDTTRVGVTGASMGGYTTFILATEEERLLAAAPLIGSPDLRSLEEDPDLPESDPETSDLIRRINPLANSDRFWPKALLVQNGEIDPVVPVSGAQRLDDRLSELYQDGQDRYRFISYPDVRHEVTDGMMEQVVRWFGRFLGE